MSLRVEQEGRAALARREGAGTRAAARAEVNFERLRAPFSLRCGALLIDYILVAAVMAFATLLARLFGDMRRGSSFVLTAGYIAVASVVIINFILAPAFSGRTIGKWMAGLRIERSDGEPLSIPRALVRHLLGYALTGLTLGLGFLISVFSSKGRALHDLIAGTVVVRSRGPRR